MLKTRGNTPKLSILIVLLMTVCQLFSTTNNVVFSATLPPNLALIQNSPNVTYSAGSIYQNSDYYVPSKAFDGKLNTRWASVDSGNKNQLTLMVDFGENGEKTVNYFKFKTYSPNVYKFNVEYSNEVNPNLALQSDWKIAYESEEMSGTTDWVEGVFTPVTARHFRLRPTKCTSIGVVEFQLYNLPQPKNLIVTKTYIDSLRVPQYSTDDFIYTYIVNKIQCELEFQPIDNYLNLPISNLSPTYIMPDTKTFGDKNITFTYMGKTTVLPVEVTEGSMTKNYAADLNFAAYTAGSSNNSYLNNPAKAFDNNNISRWKASDASRNNATVNWLQVDLGAPTKINLVKFLDWNSSIISYIIQSSSDGFTWENVYTTNELDSLNHKPQRLLTSVFTPKTARYWRVQPTAIESGYDASVCEFQLYNTPNIVNISANKFTNMPLKVNSTQLEVNEFFDKTLTFDITYEGGEKVSVSPKDMDAKYSINTSLPAENAVCNITCLGVLFTTNVNIKYSSQISVASGLRKNSYTASSEYSPPYHAFNGSGPWVAKDNNNQWIMVDLGKVQPINYIKLGNFEDKIKSYKVYSFANEGDVPTLILDSTTPIPNNSTIIPLLSTVNARYVKLVVVEAASNPGLSEFGVYYAKNDVVINSNPYFTQNGEALTKLSEGDIYANINVGIDGEYGIKRDISVYMALYNNGQLEKIATENYVLTNNGDYNNLLINNLKIVLEAKDIQKGSVLKMLVWTNGLEPIFMEKVGV